MTKQQKNALNLGLIELDQPLPNWSIESILEGEPPNKKDYLGKPLLILIFSLGCPGCIGRAIPFANRMAYENEGTLNVLGIHTNFEGVDFSKEQFTKAIAGLYIRFPIYKDQNFNTTFLDYGAGGTPHWVLVDKDGNVIYSIFGSAPNNALLRLDLKIKESQEIFLSLDK